jgi:uncharacterized protein YciI
VHYALFYEYVPDILERRKPFREEHLALLRKLHGEGRLVMAGAYQPADGALLLFRGDSPADAEAFVKADPYARNGLVTSWRVREWTVAIGA